MTLRRARMSHETKPAAVSIPSGTTVRTIGGPFAGDEGFYIEQCQHSGWHYVELPDNRTVGRAGTLWLRTLVREVAIL